ncbi:MAG: ATP-binding cassette domain-containing protein [Kiritimatiellae bacterium]|nr:ATP-binding cassette domain-containing protein [Kiritimatiellia bacterium]
MESVTDIIELSHVDAGYGRQVVLRDLNFSVRRGEIFVMLGGSGCGKSTVLKHMIGLNPVLGGRLAIDGLEWTAKTRQTLTRKIGVMFQSGALFGSMTCLENVMLPLEEFSGLSRAGRIGKAMELLAAVELEDAAEKLPGEISGGMRKRAAIARAMALDPEILFLDEPSAGLDPITASALDDLVLRLRDERSTTFVVVTHELPSIRKIADRAVMFDKARGGAVAIGGVRELEESEDEFTRRFFARGGGKI